MGSVRISYLRALCPVVVNSILRVGGRLQRSPLPVETRHTIIMRSKHHVTSLIVDHFHVQEGHCGTIVVLYTLNATRERFWIIEGHSTVKRVFRNCFRCKCSKASGGSQIMSPFPEFRLLLGKPAFSCSGVDFLGPILIKLGCSDVKRYVCVFSCLAAIAIHLEVAFSLDTSSFLQALQRFVSRRGKPEMLVSDNATNFVGAN